FWDRSNFSVLSRYDKNGKQLPGFSIPSAANIALGPAGELYLSGFIKGTVLFGNKIFSGDFSSFVCKYNADGSLVWATHLKGTDPVQSFGIDVDAEGNSYITGNFWGTFVVGKDTVREVGSKQLAINHDVFVAKFDATGRGLWAVRGGNGAVARHGAVLVDRENRVYVSGSLKGPGTFGDKDLQGGNFMARLDPFGKVVWIKEAIGLYNGGCTFSKGPTGTLYLTGSVQGTADFDGKQIASDPTLVNHSVSFLAALRDTVPPIRPNVARGVVYNDQNGNCRLDPGESPMPEVIVKATPGDYYALTDANGRYTHNLPPGPGQYTFSQIVPALKASVVTPQCPVANTYTVTFEETGEVRDNLHFGNQVISRPLVVVGIGADRRRRCFRGETVVQYTNEGWGPAVDVQVKVVYPEYVVPLSSSVPWTKRQGDTLFFSIGTLPGNTTGVITLIDSVSCGNESIRGLTQCVKAFITPRNNAGPPDPQWDRSSLELTARCRNNGFVRLV
ncbi:MAG: hypothetical protein ICV83_35820, partial [Cytophagales bacterium]|nr:hypothetical protein [Cytophagales bacterium]